MSQVDSVFTYTSIHRAIQGPKMAPSKLEINIILNAKTISLLKDNSRTPT